MGRHTAADGEAVHPMVAAALAGRPAETAGAHRGEPTQRIEGPLGWPGDEPAGGGGLGWPGDLSPTAPVGPVRDVVIDDVVPGADEVVEPVPVTGGGRRRGWRRLFGSERAA